MNREDDLSKIEQYLINFNEVKSLAVDFSTLENLTKSLKEHAEKCEKTNRVYLPEDPIKCLIIGESPPADGTYFCIPKKLKNNSKTIPGHPAFCGWLSKVHTHFYKKGK